MLLSNECLLQSVTTQDRSGDLANDKWVVENYLYGIDFYSSGSEVLVFVGARFGLEAIVAYYNFKPREIIVIEEDEYKLAILTAC